MTHDLKILPEYFMAVALDEKTFEIRKNDSGYRVGDCLVLREWDGQEFTGRNIVRYVSYILYDWQAGLKDGYCIMSLKRSPENFSNITKTNVIGGNVYDMGRVLTS